MIRRDTILQHNDTTILDTMYDSEDVMSDHMAVSRFFVAPTLAVQTHPPSVATGLRKITKISMLNVKLKNLNECLSKSKVHKM